MPIPPEGWMSIPHFRSIRIKDEIKTTTHATHNNKIMHGFINLSLSACIYLTYVCLYVLAYTCAVVVVPLCVLITFGRYFAANLLIRGGNWLDMCWLICEAPTM